MADQTRGPGEQEIHAGAAPFGWGSQLAGQLAFYWDVQFRPRLAGLTDEEYFWEPVPGCWTLRRGEDGRYVPDNGRDRDPAPVTTIAWRMVHIGAYCLANRAAAFFGGHGGAGGGDMFDARFVPAQLPGTATEALGFLDDSYQRWREGITSLSEAGLRAPLGPRGGPFAQDPMAALVLHISREVMHHGGEICLLRDLYRATGAGNRDSRLVPSGSQPSRDRRGSR